MEARRKSSDAASLSQVENEEFRRNRQKLGRLSFHFAKTFVFKSLSSNLNKDECIENIGKILGIDGLGELPHYDTINDFLSGLSTGELEHIRTYMIKELLKKRCFEN